MKAWFSAEHYKNARVKRHLGIFGGKNGEDEDYFSDSYIGLNVINKGPFEFDIEVNVKSPLVQYESIKDYFNSPERGNVYLSFNTANIKLIYCNVIAICKYYNMRFEEKYTKDGLVLNVIPKFIMPSYEFGGLRVWDILSSQIELIHKICFNVDVNDFYHKDSPLDRAFPWCGLDAIYESIFKSTTTISATKAIIENSYDVNGNSYDISKCNIDVLKYSTHLYLQDIADILRKLNIKHFWFAPYGPSLFQSDIRTCLPTLSSIINGSDTSIDSILDSPDKSYMTYYNTSCIKFGDKYCSRMGTTSLFDSLGVTPNEFIHYYFPALSGFLDNDITILLMDETKYNKLHTRGIDNKCIKIENPLQDSYNFAKVLAKHKSKLNDHFVCAMTIYRAPQNYQTKWIMDLIIKRREFNIKARVNSGFTFYIKHL